VLKQLLKKDNDSAAIEQEFSKDLDNFLKIQSFAGIGSEFASRICSLGPIKKTETAKAIIANFFHCYP
jgi:hypothetical protein